MDYTPAFETAVQTFVLDRVPAHTPSGARFFLRTSLEAWAGGLPELAFQREAGMWVLRRAYPLGTLLAYKVMRDAEASEEGDRWGQRRPDRYHLVTGEATHRLTVESWQDRGQTTRPGSLTGTTEQLTVHSPELGHDFEVTVWLPPGYPDTAARSPVLYLHDGDNVFNRATSFAGVEWGCDEAAEALARAGLPCLLVAVPVRPGHRGSDYVPFAIPANGQTSSAAEYQQFLSQTLKSLIDQRFRTRPEATHTAQAGSSFGGVASLYGGLSRPDVWGTIGAFSPSLWVQDGGLFGWSRQHPAPETRLYLDMGTREGDSLTEAAWMVHLTRLYAAQMHAHVAEVRLTLGEGHRHDEAAWAERFPGFLLWWLQGLPA